jgi:hypothetical protein
VALYSRQRASASSVETRRRLVDVEGFIAAGVLLRRDS